MTPKHRITNSPISRAPKIFPSGSITATSVNGNLRPQLERRSSLSVFPLSIKASVRRNVPQTTSDCPHPETMQGPKTSNASRTLSGDIGAVPYQKYLKEL